MVKWIIFDYDGVIVDSFPIVYEIYKMMCLKLNKEFPKDIEGFKKVYDHTSSGCYNHLGFS